MERITFEYMSRTKNPEGYDDDVAIVIESDSLELTEIVARFEQFLRGCGFHFADLVLVREHKSVDAVERSRGAAVVTKPAPEGGWPAFAPQGHVLGSAVGSRRASAGSVGGDDTVQVRPDNVVNFPQAKRQSPEVCQWGFGPGRRPDDLRHSEGNSHLDVGSGTYGYAGVGLTD